MWTVYGVSVGDCWVWGPNGTGLGLGLMQLALKLVFRREGSAEGARREAHGLVADSKSDFSDEEG